MKPQPFVLPTPDVIRERGEAFDVYRPPDHSRDGGIRRPAVVFVHGGPRPPGVEWRPRDQPVFVGYGSAAAAKGLVGVTVEHHMTTLSECASAADEISGALDEMRTLAGVDPDRVGLWFFSGGGLLSSDWLKDPPTWLRCLALTYPVLRTLPEWQVEPRFDPTLAVPASRSLPILLTRVGKERAEFSAGVAGFVDAARSAHLEIIDVPNGRHGFDMLDHTEESRSAVDQALNWVHAQLQ